MQIYIHKNNEQLGPFTEAEIKAQLASGAISLDDNVWWQGQAEWMPLGQSPLAGSLSSTAPAPVPSSVVSSAGMTGQKTSALAIWSLVCGVLICIPFSNLAAIILGHLGLSAIKKDPNLKGRGLALAGTIIGYISLILGIIYVLFIFVVLGSQVKDVFSTIQSQLQQQEMNSAQGTDDKPATP